MSSNHYITGALVDGALDAPEVIASGGTVYNWDEPQQPSVMRSDPEDEFSAFFANLIPSAIYRTQVIRPEYL